LAELEQIFKLAVAERWEANDFLSDYFSQTDLLRKSKVLEDLVGDLVFVGLCLTLFDLNFFQLLGGEDLIFLDLSTSLKGLLIGFLFESVLALLFDLAATLFFFLALFVCCLLA
jgi:hypothetical protein